LTRQLDVVVKEYDVRRRALLRRSAMLNRLSRKAVDWFVSFN
jgi:hypothetical protein